MGNPSNSNNTSTEVIVFLVIAAIVLLGAAYWLLSRKSPSSSMTDTVPESQEMAPGEGTQSGTSIPTVMPQPTASAVGLQTAAQTNTNLDASEQDVSKKLNSLDTGAKDIDQGINETPVDLSQ